MPQQIADGSSDSPTGWLSIRRACEILGVNQATLRHWTDSGRVPAFLTPGGHRRYREQDLLALTRQGTQRAEGRRLEAVLLRSRERYESVVRQCLGSSPWFHNFDAEARLRFRILGNSMLRLLTGYAVASSRRERQRCLREGQEVAAQYGKESARLGLSLKEATEAFLLFRGPVLASINQWLRTTGTASVQASEALQRINHFIDQGLIGLAEAHEQARAGRNRVDGS